jgi:hypothetical protein
MQRATHLTALLGVLRLFGTERGLALSLQLGCSGCRDRGCGGGACSWPTLCRRKNVKVIQEMLGHASAAMTLDVYAEPAPRRCYFYLPGDGGSRRPFIRDQPSTAHSGSGSALGPTHFRLLYCHGQAPDFPRGIDGLPGMQEVCGTSDFCMRWGYVGRLSYLVNDRWRILARSALTGQTVPPW